MLFWAFSSAKNIFILDTTFSISFVLCIPGTCCISCIFGSSCKFFMHCLINRSICPSAAEWIFRACSSLSWRIFSLVSNASFVSWHFLRLSAAFWASFNFWSQLLIASDRRRFTSGRLSAPASPKICSALFRYCSHSPSDCSLNCPANALSFWTFSSFWSNTSFFSSKNSLSGTLSVSTAGFGWWSEPQTGHLSPSFKCFARSPAWASKNVCSRWP